MNKKNNITRMRMEINDAIFNNLKFSRDFAKLERKVIKFKALQKLQNKKLKIVFEKKELNLDKKYNILIHLKDTLEKKYIIYSEKMNNYLDFLAIKIKEKENANTKITFQGEKGLFHIRMENMNQLINKSKIDKAVKSVINNIPSNLSYDKNRNRVYISLDDKNDNKKRVKKNDINIINEDYNFYDIYLEKKIPKKIDGQNNINNNNMKNEKDKNTNFEMKNYLRESKRGFLNDDKKNNNQDIYIFKKINNNILNKSDKKNNKLISRNDGKDLIFNNKFNENEKNV